jgi:uncharacterized phage protein gp47/JayE
MSFDSTGLTLQRYDEILETLNARLQDTLGQPVDVSENSVVGHLHSNFAYALAELWEMGQGVYDSTKLYDAEGEGLDNLAILSGIVRESAKQTQGTLYFTGLDGTEIISGSRLKSIRDETFVTKNTFTITSASCVTARLHISIVLDSTNYVVSVNGVNYSITSGVSATREEIFDALKVELDGSLSASIDTTVVVDAEDDTLTYLEIDLINKVTTLNINASTYMHFDFVVTPFTVYSEEYGPIAGDALSINGIITSRNGLYSVVNPSDLTIGSLEETDDVLRLRILNDFTTVGSGTVESILTSVRAIENVAAVFVRENTTTSTDAAGLPPKSYEVIVHEGLAQDIGNVIWKTKPAGIHLHKDPINGVDVTVVDFNGYEKEVRFSRPTEKYVTVNVDYTIYDEEEFIGAEAITAAKQAILEYGSSLSIDNDVIAKRFLQAIYNSASGFGDLVIEVGYNDSPVITPVSFVESSLAISETEISSFALDRINFTDVT